MALALITLGCALLGLIGLRQVIWRRAFWDARKYHGEIFVTFSSDRIHVESLEGESNLKWGFFSAYLDTPKYILLYTTKRDFSVIPKSAFDEPQAEEAFRLLVTSKLPLIE
ncbi:MAG: YcxB family protein [Leptolyngbyaceae cyanobacterium SM1_1_3]|nr:YcxB family protein [Leptolyngbyaceae cyanobacterium SM1_1_3]NJN04843.1 YcxB family protein [Leptolyngbyaceae cyanobacterium RM1_1_2]NJO08766.1 YcxB family protein [Leptolyngbyaceae cyanobacterium SL_1_1]